MKKLMEEVVNPMIDERINYLIYNHYLANGLTLDRDREMWYDIKEIEEIMQYEEQYNDRYEKGFETMVNGRVSKAIEKIAESGDPLIYKRLGLHEAVDMMHGEVPLLIVMEKKKSIFVDLAYKYNAGIFFSTGQVTTRMCAYFAEYIVSTGYGKGQILMITDYDGAGESLYRAVKKKIELFNTSRNVDIEVKWLWTNHYGSIHSGSIRTFKLKDNNTNAKWLKQNKTQGIEFNAPSNVGYCYNLAEKVLVKMIDPLIYGTIAYDSWRSVTLARLEADNAKYQKTKAKLDKINDKLKAMQREMKAEVEEMQPSFKKGTPLGFGCLLPTTRHSILLHGEEVRLRRVLGHTYPY